MFATFNSGNANPYLNTSRSYMMGSGNIKKSVSNSQLDKSHYWERTKGLSSHALDHGNNSLEKLANSQSEIKCHHLSTTNLDTIKPQFRGIEITKSKPIMKGSHSSLHENTFITINSSPELGISRNVKSFLSCSKPCGVVMTILGTILFITSSLFFIFFLEKNICDLLNICTDSLLNKVYMTSALVCGFFMIVVGVTIVIYVEKDLTANVIVLQKKRRRQNHHQRRQHQQQQQQPDPERSNEVKTSESKSRVNRLESIDFNEYNFVPYNKRESVIDRHATRTPLLKKNKVIININDELAEEQAEADEE